MDGVVIGVLRGGEPIIASRWELLKRTGGLVGIAVFVGFGVVLIFFVVRRVAIPIETLREGASQFAQGKLDKRLDETDTARGICLRWRGP